ncbi:hypothetical protein CGC52_04325 [Capnocytophaga sp. H2931]|nr:hypothetical protein CGC52_04325 [Capnocytophaga sp. H2931]
MFYIVAFQYYYISLNNVKIKKIILYAEWYKIIFKKLTLFNRNQVSTAPKKNFGNNFLTYTDYGILPF